MAEETGFGVATRQNSDDPRQGTKTGRASDGPRIGGGGQNSDDPRQGTKTNHLTWIQYINTFPGRTAMILDRGLRPNKESPSVLKNQLAEQR